MEPQPVDVGWDVVDLDAATSMRDVSVVGFRRHDDAGLDRRVLPHRAVTVVLELSGGRIQLDTATRQVSSSHFVAGLSTAPLRIRAANVECIELQMSPVVAGSLLGVDLGAIAGGPHELHDLWGSSARELHGRLFEATSWRARAHVVRSALERRRAAGDVHVDPEVAGAWDAIARSRGTVPVSRLVRESGWSHKRLWSRFSSQIGLSPKRAAMLARFEHASHRLGAGGRPAEVAADCGYVDQSHLHRDVMSFAGCAPSQLVAARGTADR